MTDASLGNSTEDLTADASVRLTVQDRIAGRYEIIRRLGAGAMSTVYLAHDHKNSQDIAIKFMKSELGGSARRRFFREFNTIAGIQHPCCLRVFEIGETAEAPYFTMELHPGRPVTSILGDAPETVAPMLVDLTLAVDYIHSQGIVHRDIKPSNVMVQRCGGESHGRLTCKLADFGLAKFYQLDSSLTNERGMVGTPAYCAPEQIDGACVDHRVDLYAVGVLAYELLSGGRHPYATARQAGLHALLHAHLSSDATLLREINPHIPETLSQVVASYLSKQADMRPNSAAALRAVLCEEYGIEVDARLAELSSPSEVMLNAVGFVCREAELAAVDAFLRSQLQPPEKSSRNDAGGSLMLFSGEPGTGKTSLMQESVRRAIGLNYRVHESRCLDGATSPFQPIIQVIRQILVSTCIPKRDAEASTLLADFPSSSSEAQKILTILKDYQSEILLIAPELRRWLSGATYEPVLQNDPQYLIRTLAALFVDLSQIAPLCLCIDDIQWADNSTLDFLKQLAAQFHRDRHQISHPTSFSKGLVILCTGRSGYPQLAAFRGTVQSQAPLAEMELQPLSLVETRKLLGLRLGSLPESIGERLVESIGRLCQGNPFFISETIREWYAQGFVIRTQSGWQRVHRTLEDDSSLPDSVRSALRMRMDDLSEVSQNLLTIAAAIGPEVDLDLLSEVASQVDDAQLLDAVEEMIAKRIFVESKHSASRVAFSHDLLRETVGMVQSASRRRSIHRRIAAVLAVKPSDRKPVPQATLGRHYLAAEMLDEAFACYLEAAESALATYAFADALNYLQFADDNRPDAVSNQLEYRLHKCKSIALLGEGTLSGASIHAVQKVDSKDLQGVAGAIQVAETALRFAESDLDRGRVLFLLGRCENARGEVLRSRQRHNEALKALGIRCPTSLPGKLLAIQYNLLSFHCFPSRLLKLLNGSEKRLAEHSLACEVLYEAAHSYAVNDLATYTQICTENVRLSKTLPDDAGRAVAYGKYGLNLGFSGLNARIGLRPKSRRSIAVRYCEKAVEFALNSGRPDILASVQTSLSLVLYCCGQLRQAEKVAREAEKPLRRCRELHTAYCYHYLRHVYSVTGEIDKLLEAALQELDMASATGMTELMGWAHYGLTHGHALRGDMRAALESAETSIAYTSGNQSSFCAISFMEQGFALLQNSQYDAARKSYQQAHQLVKQRLFFFEIVMYVYPRMVEALLGPAWSRGKSAEDCHRRAARKFLRIARFFSYSYPNIIPQMYRMRGRYYMATGRTATARKCLQRAVNEAGSLGAEYERARALIDLGAVSPAHLASQIEGLDLLDALGAVMPQAERDLLKGIK